MNRQNITTPVRPDEGESFPSVRCPKCGWRLCDRESRTSGTLEFKCIHCRRKVKVDLSYRRAGTALARRIASWM